MGEITSGFKIKSHANFLKLRFQEKKIVNSFIGNIRRRYAIFNYLAKIGLKNILISSFNIK